MRKHNHRFAQRWTREAGDRSNFPQQMSHSFVNSKVTQFFSNGLLQAIMVRAGIQLKGIV
jgi:hypothetical protein